MLQSVVLAVVLGQAMWESQATGLAPRESSVALARELSADKAKVRKAAAKTLHSRIRHLASMADRPGFRGQEAANELVVVAHEVAPRCAEVLLDPVVTGRCADILAWVPVAEALPAVLAARAEASPKDQARLDAAAAAIRAAHPDHAESP